ncbi:MAG: His-Xaa-Ser system protein HxsD [Methylobacter sp.]
MTKHELTFDVRVFSLETVKRALYRCQDKCSFDIQLKDNDIVVSVASSIDGMTDRIRREVLDQDLRDTISKETANIRQLILANAFSNTELIS